MDGYIINDGLVRVGNGILWVAGTTYPIRSINSIRATATDNKFVRGLGAVVAIFFVLLIFVGLFSGELGKETFFTCAFGVACGVAMYRNCKDKYRLFVNTIGGEKQVLVSHDAAYVKQVRASIEECIATEAGGSSHHEKSRMGPIIDGTVQRGDGLLPRS